MQATSRQHATEQGSWLNDQKSISCCWRKVAKTPKVVNHSSQVSSRSINNSTRGAYTRAQPANQFTLVRQCGAHLHWLVVWGHDSLKYATRCDFIQQFVWFSTEWKRFNRKTFQIGKLYLHARKCSLLRRNMQSSFNGRGGNWWRQLVGRAVWETVAGIARRKSGWQ